MRFDIISLFPEVITPYLDASILRRAQAGGHVDLNVHDLRTFADGKHRVTDEPPFGGGGGMILKPEPIFKAVETIAAPAGTPIVLMTPQGRQFDQTLAAEWATLPQIVLICGRYEGFDERVRDHLITDELSIGDFVLTGGELPAMMVVDAVTRLLPNVLGAEGAAAGDSYATGLLEGAHYTKPISFRGNDVPEVLRSGKGQAIERWRRESALRRTWERRPDLLFSAELDAADKRFLAQLARESAEKRIDNG